MSNICLPVEKCNIHAHQMLMCVMINVWWVKVRLMQYFLNEILVLESWMELVLYFIVYAPCSSCWLSVNMLICWRRQCPREAKPSPADTVLHITNYILYNMTHNHMAYEEVIFTLYHIMCCTIFDLLQYLLIQYMIIFGSRSVLGMSLRKGTSLGSNLASATDLKRIETPHSLCCDFGGDKPLVRRHRVQVLARAGHMAISPKV